MIHPLSEFEFQYLRIVGLRHSQHKETKKKLKEIKASVDAQPTPATSDKELLAMNRCAAKLRQVMETLLDRGGKDTKCIRKVEALSESILDNLSARITQELIQSGDFERIKDEIMRAAKELDTVRATPATTVIESCIDRARQKVNAEQEKSAQETCLELKEVMDRIAKEPAKLVSQAGQVLDLVRKAHAEAPDSKRVIGPLLKCLLMLSNLFLKLKATWLGDAGIASALKAVAQRGDDIARKLVPMMEGTWDTPMAPLVQREINLHTGQLSIILLSTAERELGSDNVGGAYDAMELLQPWWIFLKDVEATSLQVLELFGKFHSCATQEFSEATKNGDRDTAEAVRQFAGKCETLRSKFEGLPAESRGLVASLQLRDVKAVVDQQLAFLDAEVEKGGLSLAKVVKALETLIPIWKTVYSADEAYGTRLQNTCRGLEAWAEKTAAACPTSKVNSLVKFAEAYDDRRLRLSPPESATGPLQPRIAEMAAASHLKVVEEELSKVKGMNSKALLEGLAAASEALHADCGSEAVKGHLSSAMDTTMDRVAKTFNETVRAGDSRKREALQQFAGQFDEVRAGGLKGASKAGVKAPPAPDGLVARLQKERQTIFEEQLTTIEDVLNTSSKLDIAQLLKALQLVQTFWPEQPCGLPLLGRLLSVLAPLEGRVIDAGSQAALTGETAAADMLLQQAGELDAALAVFRRETTDGDTSKPLRSQVLGHALHAHLVAAHAALRASAGPDCELLAKELAAMQVQCDDETCPAEACTEVLALIDSLEAPLVGAAGERESVVASAALRVAGIADETRAATVARLGPDAEKKERAALRPMLQAAKAAADKLGEMEAELDNPSGMNPKAVVQTLQALEPLWALVGPHEAFQQRLLHSVACFSERLKETCRQALRVEPRWRALLALTGDAEAKQEALMMLSPGLQFPSLESPLCRVVADHQLQVMEAELGKRSGMNPQALLTSVQGISEVWGKIGGVDPLSFEFDEVCSIKSRLSQATSEVHTRMHESMHDAVSTGNANKKTALIGFARDWDAAFPKEEGSEETLSASLEAASEKETD